ncbi:MAG: pilus assembly protein PilM [bacterium]|nr:pilus assembly protein PilM [bacterium]
MLFSSKRSVGIDIADHTVELVVLERSGARMRVAGLGRVALLPGTVVHGRIKDKVKLSTAFKKLFAEVKPRATTPTHAVVGLPDSQIYTSHIDLPEHETHDRDSLVAVEAEKNIPLHTDEQVMSYRVLASGKDKTEVLITATPLDVITEWNDFFVSLKIKVDVFDVEALATYRGLFARPPKSPICVVDIGALITGVSIFDSFGLRYSNSVDVAGDLLTDEVAKAIKKGEREAEVDKKNIGLTAPGEPISSAIIKGLTPVLKELQSAIKFFEKESGESVREMILVGGSSGLKGLAEYFNANLGIAVRVGKQAVIKNDVPLQYIESVGLALRGLDARWQERDPGLLPSMRLETYKTKERGGNPLSVIMGMMHTSKMNPGRPKPVIEPMADGEGRAKLSKEKIVLGLLLIVLIILGAGGYWYRIVRISETSDGQIAPAPFVEEEVVEEEQDPNTEIVIVEDPVDLLPTVTVLKTETGWLRVRGGPGTSFSEVAKINPGESYPLLEEDEEGEWVKIQIDGETEGWVFSIYISKDADE